MEPSSLKVSQFSFFSKASNERLLTCPGLKNIGDNGNPTVDGGWDMIWLIKQTPEYLRKSYKYHFAPSNARGSNAEVALAQQVGHVLRSLQLKRGQMVNSLPGFTVVGPG